MWKIQQIIQEKTTKIFNTNKFEDVIQMWSQFQKQLII